MRCEKINQGWYFGMGDFDVARRSKKHFGDQIVNLPHDYMIGTDVFREAPSGGASGYYNAGVAHYVRELEIPAEWDQDRICLRVDGAMMNATVEVNGSMAVLQHYGYAPFETDITRLVYPGKTNRIVITLNPSMQPNSRWYSGAGLFRGVELIHTPPLRVAFGGLAGYTRKIETAADGTPETAYLAVSAEVQNCRAENRVAEVFFDLIREDSGETVLSRKTVVQVQAMSLATARMTMTVDQPLLWCAEEPNLYRLQARVRDLGAYKTHIIRDNNPAGGTAKLYASGTFNAVTGTFNPDLVETTANEKVITDPYSDIASATTPMTVSMLIVPTPVSVDDELSFTFTLAGGESFLPFVLKKEHVRHADDSYGFRAGYTYTFNFTVDNYVYFNGFTIDEDWSPADTDLSPEDI